MQQLTYVYICQVPRSATDTPLWLIHLRYLPEPIEIDQPTALPPDEDMAIDHVILRQGVLAQLRTINMKVSEILAQEQAWYSSYYNKQLRNLPAFAVGETVYVNQKTLNIFAADQQASLTHNELMARDRFTTASLKFLEVRDHVLTIDKIRIGRTGPGHKAAPSVLTFASGFVKARNIDFELKTCGKPDNMSSSSTKMYLIVKHEKITVPTPMVWL